MIPALACRCATVIACIVSIVLSAMLHGEDYFAVLSWEELAAHAGLVGLKAKTKEQFKADVDFVAARNISAMKAVILLSPEEWAWLSSSTPNHLLHPWTTDKMDSDIWKSTVDLGLASSRSTVDVSRLNLDDKAVILRRPGMSLRVYMLSPNADGKSGVLFYFFNRPG